MKVTVLGAGGWGTALALVLADNKHDVTLWEYNTEYSKTLDSTRYNPLYLPDILIPQSIKINPDLHSAIAGKELIILAVPSQYIRKVLVNVNYSEIQNSYLVNVAKGIETSTLMTMSQMLHDVFPEIHEDQICTLSGPSHAEEVGKKIPTAVVAGSQNHKTSKLVQSAFMNKYFRVYSSEDILGVELGGSLKNVIAIGTGIIEGAKFGDNTKAAIMTRGVAEISRLGIAMGADPKTFMGLSGMGDLIVTCGSKHSRNRFVGEQIGSGKKLAEVIEQLKMVAEGVETSKSAKALAKKLNVEVPIISEVNAILFKDKDPIKATYDLMTRDMKKEH